MTDENSSPPALAISGEFTIFTAADLKPRLLHAVIDAESEDVDIDLSEVSEIDSAGLQLLLATRRSVAERGASLQITGLSGSAADALAVFGLDARLDTLVTRNGARA